MDAYGPTVPIGGGAWSGKDFNKVDRIGGLMAREIALEAVVGKARYEARVELRYEPGRDRPAAASLWVDGDESVVSEVQLQRTETLSSAAAFRRLIARLGASLVAGAQWGQFLPKAGRCEEALPLEAMEA